MPDFKKKFEKMENWSTNQKTAWFTKLSIRRRLHTLSAFDKMWLYTSKYKIQHGELTPAFWKRLRHMVTVHGYNV